MEEIKNVILNILNQNRYQITLYIDDFKEKYYISRITLDTQIPKELVNATLMPIYPQKNYTFSFDNEILEGAVLNITLKKDVVNENRIEYKYKNNLWELNKPNIFDTKERREKTEE